ncbi:MAG: hypothetical protein KO318_03290 [Methanobacterium sp.]|jgi:hypothetical protein|uniref:Uncharacterized protein n=1 Tax=Methanobacterium subterraneum TaxID=59277 RepID=A0A2H4VNR4_9EURY|nr:MULTISPECIES: hypothetical protein [Methanobacterium]AUB59743.1 hypothetical protein BK009_03045 [Methanobacterium subterraneum]MCC7559447.1 hypothetical protein [Methanobacterium sp.]
MSDNKSNSAKNELPPISPEALSSFQENSASLIKETVSRSLKRDHEVVHHGEKAPELLTTGLEFTTKMLEAAMSMGEVALLEDELKWAKERLPHDGVKMEHVLHRFKIYRDVVQEILPSEYATEITAFMDWMINYQQAMIESD